MRPPSILSLVLLSLLVGFNRESKADQIAGNETQQLRVDLLDGSRIVGQTKMSSFRLNIGFHQLRVPLPRILRVNRVGDPDEPTQFQVQFTNDESALKTLWLMICNIEDKRAAKRAKQGKRVSRTAGRLMEGARVSGWKQAINQMAVAFPDRLDKYL